MSLKYVCLSRRNNSKTGKVISMEYHRTDEFDVVSSDIPVLVETTSSGHFTDYEVVTGAVMNRSILLFTALFILWHVDTLLGNDREISHY
jgi:hypothetical protein